jgi:hypothetical protein
MLLRHNRSRRAAAIRTSQIAISAAMSVFFDVRNVAPREVGVADVSAVDRIDDGGAEGSGSLQASAPVTLASSTISNSPKVVDQLVACPRSLPRR